MNNVCISGRLTRDPELKYLQSGMAVAKVTIAFDTSYKKGDEWINDPNFLDCTLWKDKAESFCSRMTKGKEICFEGSLKMESWEKDGQKRSKMGLTVNRVHYIEKFTDGEQPKKSEQINSNDDPF